MSTDEPIATPLAFGCASGIWAKRRGLVRQRGVRVSDIYLETRTLRDDFDHRALAITSSA